jgi:hypothetical protein
MLAATAIVMKKKRDLQNAGKEESHLELNSGDSRVKENVGQIPYGKDLKKDFIKTLKETFYDGIISILTTIDSKDVKPTKAHNDGDLLRKADKAQQESDPLDGTQQDQTSINLEQMDVIVTQNDNVQNVLPSIKKQKHQISPEDASSAKEVKLSHKNDKLPLAVESTMKEELTHEKMEPLSTEKVYNIALEDQKRNHLNPGSSKKGTMIHPEEENITTANTFQNNDEMHVLTVEARQGTSEYVCDEKGKNDRII